MDDLFDSEEGRRLYERDEEAVRKLPRTLGGGFMAWQGDYGNGDPATRKALIRQFWLFWLIVGAFCLLGLWL
jgi:hypothetical protein